MPSPVAHAQLKPHTRFAKTRRQEEYPARLNSAAGFTISCERTWAIPEWSTFNHGVPAPLEELVGKKAPSKAMLHNMLEELMSWHAALLQSILEHHKHPDMATARKLASLDQNMWQVQRRQRKLEAKQRMVQGTRLMQKRDSGKRKFDDMSATQQQILEDFDTSKSAKRHHGECERSCRFSATKCCELSVMSSPNATATEHGCCLIPAVTLDRQFP